jgi:hypothetical protein
MASRLYHPDTVERSLRHDGSGDEPGIKDPDGKWDLRPHRARIIRATDETLQAWHAVLEDDSVPVRWTRMLYTVNSDASEVLTALVHQPRASSLGLEASRGWDERKDQEKGYIISLWGTPNSWNDVILQGPHLYVSTPMYKSVNSTMKNKQDWAATDIEKLPTNAIPVTAFKPSGDRARYDADYTQWEIGPARSYYRIAWRRMAANVGERTLIPALIPPGAAHPDTVSSAGMPADPVTLVTACGFLSSLVLDFAVRAAPKGDIRIGTINRLPVRLGHPLQSALLLRALRLNCVTEAYADIWRDVFQGRFVSDQWASVSVRANRPELGAISATWEAETPIRLAEDRRQSLVEIDALVALMLDVTVDQLCTIYRTQFPVLYGYDYKENFYDANGRLVPNSVLSVWRKTGDSISGADRTATNQAGHTYIYELPFRLLDREADMRTAYAEFERRLAAL